MEINPFFSKWSACWCASPILFLAKWMNLSMLLESEWSSSLLRNYLCVGGVCVKYGSLAYNFMHLCHSSVQHLHFQSWFTRAGLVWDWHMLSLRVPAVQTCYCFDLILFLKHLAHSLQEGASLRGWHVSLMKIVGLFLLFRGYSCQNSVQPSPVIFGVVHFRENASTGKGCQLGPELFVPGSGREQ